MALSSSVCSGLVALALVWSGTCVRRFEVNLASEFEADANYSRQLSAVTVRTSRNAGPPEQWEHADELQKALDNAKKGIEYANKTALFLTKMAKNPQVIAQLKKLGEKGGTALKALQKAGKAAEHLTKALAVVDSVSAVAGLVGLLPIVESPEDQINRKLDEILTEVTELRSEVREGIKDIQKQQHELAKTIIAGTVTQQYVDKLVVLQKPGKIHRMLGEVMDGDLGIHRVKVYLDELLDETGMLQNAILGVGYEKPLFDTYYKNILVAFKAETERTDLEDVGEMLDMISTLTMKFSDYMGLQTTTIDVLGKFMLKLKEAGRTDIVHTYQGSIIDLANNIEAAQTLHDPMLKEAVKPTLYWTFAEKNMLWEGSEVAAVCWAATSENYEHGVQPVGTTDHNAWALVDKSQFTRDELWNFAHICIERGNFRRCQLRNEENCNRFKEKTEPLARWLITKRNVLTQRRFDLLNQMADKFTEEGHWYKRWTIENKVHWAAIGLAGRWEFHESRRCGEEGWKIEKTLSTSLI